MIHGDERTAAMHKLVTLLWQAAVEDAEQRAAQARAAGRRCPNRESWARELRLHGQTLPTVDELLTR